MRHYLLLVMAAFRFLSVSLICFMLLGPLIRLTVKVVEKPTIILGIDNSRSVSITNDSTYYREVFPKSVDSLIDILKQKCDVRVYSFSDQLSNEFDGTYTGIKTDISSFVNDFITRYTNRNTGALILATDGIYNEGSDPFYAARKITCPVYTVALGDTLLKKDILISKVIVNKTVYKGDLFPVEVITGFNKCSGSRVKLTLSKGDQLIETKEINVNNDQVVQRISFSLEAKEKGITRYNLKLNDQPGEGSFQNNSASFFVEVLEARQKIALVYDAPHPDIGALQNALEGSSHFEVELIRSTSLPASFEQYDLVILNQVPSLSSVTDLTQLFKSKASLLFIIGTQTDLNSLNNLKTGLIINAARITFADVQPILNDNFSLFSVDRKQAALFAEYPPLQSPFGNYQFNPLTEVLLYQKIGNVTSRTPLILFSRAGERKVGFITGENIWRWRIAEFVQQKCHDSFDLLVDKIAQYLSTREDKSFFRLHLKNRFSENEPIEIEAEVFNASYELINDPDVNITITDANKKNFPYTFGKNGKAYYLNAGLFSVGEYSYKASVKVGNETFTRTGKFIIEQVNVESSNLVADHNLLFRISSAHEGELVPPRGIVKLANKILARADVRPVSHYQQRMTELVGNPWLFSLILVLLATEWVLRKREGR